MKNFLFVCSLTSLLLLVSCDKHADFITPSCELTSFVQSGISCPNEVGESIEVWFEATFQCVDPVNAVINIESHGHHTTYTILQQHVSNGVTSIMYKSTITPLSGASSATVEYSLTFNGTEKHFSVTCDLVDDPDECELTQVDLVNKICPDEVGESIEVWFDIVYSCTTIPPLTLTVDENGHSVSTHTINVEQVGNTWVTHMKSSITPTPGSNSATVIYSVSLEGTTKTLSVTCNVPLPDLCQLYDLKIVNEHWLSEEKVELSLEVWFKNCNSTPVFNVEVTSNGDATIEHTGSYAQGDYLIYKIKSVVTVAQCQKSLSASYSTTFEGTTKTANFSTLLCQFTESRNEYKYFPYQNDSKKAAITFDLVFTGCHIDPVYSVAITEDIENEDISLEVLSTSHEGGNTILHMFSEVKSPTILYNNWVTYDISYCGFGVKLTFDF